jgi:hypothetical protein
MSNVERRVTPVLMYCFRRNYKEDETNEYAFFISALNGSKWLTSREPVIPFDMRAESRSNAMKIIRISSRAGN